RINPQSTTHIYTLSLHDALPIFEIADDLSSHKDKPEQSSTSEGDGPLARINEAETSPSAEDARQLPQQWREERAVLCIPGTGLRSEEHTSELQSLAYLVCRLLLE